MILTAPETRDALHALQRGRRIRRLHDLDWIEVAYKAYIAAIVSLGTLFTSAAIVGDTALGKGTVADLRNHGPAVVGLVIAVAVALGLRSGARGGPLALEPADVTHVLLAPADRAVVLRASAYRQLRGVAMVGVVGGALAGLLVAQRMPDATNADVVGWIAAGVGTGGAAVLAVWGSALVASGRRWGRLVTAAIGVVLVAWSLVDVYATTITSPASMLGALAFWPLVVRPIAVAGVVVALAVPVVGLLGIGNTSIEAAERRSGLVGALRFAATIQDLRTVIVLHRQLAQERSRATSWLRLPRGKPLGHACWRRDWQGVLRWPASRVGRVAALGVVAGLCAYGTWRGTTPLIVVAGIALFIAALDAIEPLAQEVDHPDRVQGVPIERGVIYVRHLAVPVAVMAIAGLIGLAAAAVLDPAPGVLLVGVITVVPVAFAAAAAAAFAVVLGAPKVGSGLTISFPEAATIGLILRQAFPPLLAALAIAPVIGAREAVHQHGDPFEVAALACVPALVIAGAVVAFLRTRKSVVF
ncbi:MAG: hypothetical protein ACXVJW_14125 [Acidimicrobiia bacterium]